MKDSRGTIVVQDPFQIDFCVTRAYNTQAWRNHCKFVLRTIWFATKPEFKTNKITWFDRYHKRINLLDIFEFYFEPKSPQKTRKNPNPNPSLKYREVELWYAKQKKFPQVIPTDYYANYKKESHNPIPWKLKYCEIVLEHDKQQNKKEQSLKVKETSQDIPKDYNANYKKESKNTIDFSKIDFSKGIRSRSPYQYER